MGWCKSKHPSTGNLNYFWKMWLSWQTVCLAQKALGQSSVPRTLGVVGGTVGRTDKCSRPVWTTQ